MSALKAAASLNTIPTTRENNGHEKSGWQKMMQKSTNTEKGTNKTTNQ